MVFNKPNIPMETSSSEISISRNVALIILISFVILFSGDAFSYYFSAGPAGAIHESGVNQPRRFNIAYFWFRLAITSPIIILMSLNVLNVINIIKKNIFILIFIIYIIISGAWAAEINFQKVDVEQYIMTYSLAFLCANYFSRRDIIKIFYFLGCLVVILNFIWVIFFPDISIYHGMFPGKWRGIFTHKNILGPLVGILFPIIFFSGVDCIRYKSVRILFIIGSAVILFKSGSGSGIVIAIVGLLLSTIQRIIRRENVAPLFLTIGPFVILSLIAIFTSISYVLNAVGKDITLSGRTKTWDASISIFKISNTWLGRGAGDSYSKSYTDLVKSYVGFNFDPHNGYIAILSDLGFIGFAIFIGFFGVALIQSLAPIPRNSEDWAPTRTFQVLLLCWLVAMTVESAPTSPGSTPGILAIITIFALAAGPLRSATVLAARRGPQARARRRFGPAPVVTALRAGPPVVTKPTDTDA